MRRLLFVFFWFMFALALTACAAPARFTSPPDITDVRGVLLWMTGVGAVVATNWLFGKLAESIPAWNKLPTFVKWIVPPIVAILLGFGSNWLLAQDALIAAIQPYWSLAAIILLGYFGSQLAHVQAKQAGLMCPKG